MKFEIDRANCDKRDTAPCPGAYKETIERPSGRTYECWFIDINTLEGLIDHIRAWDEDAIVSKEGVHSRYPHITIYDDYVE